MIQFVLFEDCFLYFLNIGVQTREDQGHFKKEGLSTNLQECSSVKINIEFAPVILPCGLINRHSHSKNNFFLFLYRYSLLLQVAHIHPTSVCVAENLLWRWVLTSDFDSSALSSVIHDQKILTAQVLGSQLWFEFEPVDVKNVTDYIIQSGSIVLAHSFDLNVICPSTVVSLSPQAWSGTIKFYLGKLKDQPSSSYSLRFLQAMSLCISPLGEGEVYTGYSSSTDVTLNVCQRICILWNLQITMSHKVAKYKLIRNWRAPQANKMCK